VLNHRVSKYPRHFNFDLLNIRAALRRLAIQVIAKARIAVLGHGIAVVDRANDGWVQGLLWNRSVLRIPRKEIVWNRQNSRWEIVHII